MNMMTMAKMEEASRKSWEEQLAGGPRNEEYERIPYELFQHGFVAGVAFAQRQAKIGASSQAVGNIHASKEVPQREDDKYLVWKMEDLRGVIAKDPWLRSHFHELVEEIKSFRMLQGKGENKYIVCNQDEMYADRVWRTILDGESDKAKASRYPAAVEESEEEA